MLTLFNVLLPNESSMRRYSFEVFSSMVRVISTNTQCSCHIHAVRVCVFKGCARFLFGGETDFSTCMIYEYVYLIYLKTNTMPKLFFCQNEAFSQLFSIYSHDVTRVGRTDLFPLFLDYIDGSLSIFIFTF